MGTHDDITAFLNDLDIKLKKEMPRIRREIKVYEEKLKEGRLTLNPRPSPQFGG
ncbi:hypothetical protein LV84_03638 [Algoriphagus ratkowskyi]|uniref:Uncharacterized protein n=1 Tax=Algoriphagus ratkowskyi TaxID=57028 RepID=A0A2W7RCI2_9BACT|nr:hypothetical protein [Algoriphagus ratkowskyi]PZX51879.1 hypothetical protein LV84_03638 [Algoriphagus ratkowskyi]